MNPLFIAIAIVRDLLPVIQEIVDDVNDAKDRDSDGGRRITDREKAKIATDAVLALVPKLQKILLANIK